MPRKARKDAPGALQHVIVSGIERNVYNDVGLHYVAGRLTAILPGDTACRDAWVLTPNSLPSLSRSLKVAIAAITRRLLAVFGSAFKRRYQRQGPLLQNRYKSILCQPKTQ